MKRYMVLLLLMVMAAAAISSIPAQAKGGGADEAALYYYQAKDLLENDLEYELADLRRLVSEVSSNPDVMRRILGEIQGKISTLTARYAHYQNLVEKAQTGRYVIVKLQGEYQAVSNDDYYSSVVLNPQYAVNTPEVEGRTNYLRKEGSAYLGKIEALIEECRKWQSYYLNQLSRGQGAPSPGASGDTSLGGFAGAWDVTDTHTDGCGKTYTYTVTFSGTPSAVKAEFDCYGLHTFNGTLRGNTCSLSFSWPGGNGSGTVTFSGNTLSGNFTDSLNHACTWTGRRR